MDWLTTFLLLIGISAGLTLFVLILIPILLAVLVFVFAKKYPVLALFILIIMIVVCTVESNPATFEAAIVAWTTTVITGIAQYKRLKRAFK